MQIAIDDMPAKTSTANRLRDAAVDAFLGEFAAPSTCNS
jgi:hypothetical protein